MRIKKPWRALHSIIFMKNKIKKIEVGSLKGCTLSYKSASVQIISDLGCNVNKLILKGQDVIDGNTTYEDLVSQTLCKSSLLAPFPNRINKGKYIFEGKTYQLEKNETARDNALHGLITDKLFTLLSQEETPTYISATFQYTITKDMFAGYPFALTILVRATLTENSFSLTVTAENIGKTALPYGVGWHPYIKTGKKIDDCVLALPSNEILELDNVLIPTTKVKKISPIQAEMKDSKFDTCFINKLSGKTQFDNITLFQDATMQYLQVYTPEDRNSIAIESMSCAPDAFNNKMGLLILQPREKIQHTFGIAVS